MILSRLPQHITMVMDGNGRWAAERGCSRLAGHRAGAAVLKEIVKACVEKKIPVLSVFAFSRDNWRRPKKEVDGLMKLFGSVLKREVAKLHKQNVKINFIGDRSRLSEAICKQIIFAEKTTEANTGLHFVAAIDYSGQWDLCQATQQICADFKKKSLSLEVITPELISSRLSTATLPDPDLLIRTSGEMRLSNFMLWQLSYTELYFVKCYWPDFSVLEFNKALKAYAQRERRFGAIKESVYE